jgi:multiple sugar transport system substrate-binding protein
MKFKRFLAAMLAGVMVLSLAACGGSGSSEEATSDDAAASEGGTLQVGIWDSNQEPGIKEILADFTAETGIETEITVTTWGDYWTMLSAAAQGGELPDVFWMHANESTRYMSNDMLLDLTDRIAESDKIAYENYPEDIWEIYSYNEKTYAVPKDVDTIALWYNKEIFDQAGVAYPDDTWTWENLVEAATTIYEKTGIYGYCMSSDDYQEGYGNWMYSYDGTMLDYDPLKSGFDKPESIEALQLLETLLRSGAMPSQEEISENSKDVLFNSGKVAMTTLGSWMLAGEKAMDEEFQAKIDIAVLPKSSKTDKRACIYNGLGWAAAANTDMPDQAWACIEYLGSEEAQLKQAELGVTMSAFLGTSDDWINGAPQWNLQAYLDMWENIYIFPHSKKTVEWDEKMDAVMKEVWLGNMTMEEGCHEVAAQMNAVLETE